MLQTAATTPVELDVANILKRNSGFYFRKVLPTDVKSVLNKRELHVSLNTYNKSEAEHKAGFLGLSLNYAINQLRADLETKEQALIVSSFFEQFDSAVGTIRQIEEVDSLSPQFVLASVQRKEGQPRRSQKPRGKLPLASELIATFIEHKKLSGDWADKTAIEAKQIFDLFIAVVDDTELDNYDRSTLRHFRDSLTKLPSNRSKCKPCRDMSVKELMAYDVPDAHRLSKKTVNTNLTVITTFFHWAADEYPKNIDATITRGLSVKETDSVSYQPYSEAELKQLFNIDVYTDPSNKFNNTFKFWLPLLGLYTGARLNELCQCLVSDVKQSPEGIWYIDINDEDDKRTKNSSSIRRTPIHQALIDLGFLDYVSSLRAVNHERLFPDLKKGARGWQSNASKAYSRMAKKAGIKEDRTKCFHSFRNNAVDAIAEKADKDSMVSQIVGHRQQGMTFGRYFSEYPLIQVKETIDLIEYDIPLADLKDKWRCLVS